MDRDDGEIQLVDRAQPPAGVAGTACVRLLCLAASEPAWLTLTLGCQAAGWSEQQFRWVSKPADALGLLRDEGFDCVVLASDDRRADLAVGALAEFLRALRGGGHDEGALLLAAGLSDAEWAALLEADCEVVVTSRCWECPALVPAIRRAARRAQLVRDNAQLATAQRRRLVRERDEATQLITQQWRMIEELQSLSADVSSAVLERPQHVSPHPDEAASMTPRPSFAERLPSDVAPYYHELLRIYVIMGSGSLGTEIAGLAERLAGAELTPREVLELHLERVETLVRRLGSRSARHVLARADLLALEVMMHLGECYQRRSAGATSARTDGQPVAAAPPVQPAEPSQAA